ncbi:GMP reductase [Candidatus Poseidonia alphae]|nr:GMP reductase [Candidatus Poseidonia alphae]
MNKIESGEKLDFNHVLIRPKRSTINSRSEVSLEKSCKFKHSPLPWNGVPIIAANMDTTGTFEIYKTLYDYKMITTLHKFYSKEDYITFSESETFDPNYFMVSTGISDKDYDRLVSICDSIGVNWICIDIANGYISNLVTFCKKVREKYPDKTIVAGNVVTREMVEELILTGGVDIVKIGIGPGSACTTRIKTGVGMPQLSAVIECSDAAHGVGGHIISDGGITCPGDMAKAFGGGADFVMVGGQFAGHDQNPGEIIEENGKSFKMFYGMSSDKAQNTHYGKMEKYRASEGRVLKIPYKGDLNNTVLDYLGGLRSTCAYINAPNIKHMAKCTTFVRVSQQVNSFFV